FMVPPAIVVLDSLPLTASGKIDRRALPLTADTGSAVSYEAAATPVESLLCTIVAELLALTRVGVGDHFFHLGGDSISSIRLVSRARERGLTLTPKDVFEHPVLRDLARV